MPTVARNFFSRRSHVSFQNRRNVLAVPLLVWMAVVANQAAQAQAQCSAPWASVTQWVGTLSLRGSGTALSPTTRSVTASLQSDALVNMDGLYSDYGGGCLWHSSDPNIGPPEKVASKSQSGPPLQI